MINFFGVYNPNDQSIFLDIDNHDIESAGFRQTFVHEMLHCYSGTTILFEDNKYSVTRVGLQGLNYEKTKFFNEAYTQWATLSLLGINYKSQDLVNDFIKSEAYESIQFSLDNPFVDTAKLTTRLLEKDMSEIASKYGGLEYLAERIALAFLDTVGIDLMSIGEAYFESYYRISNQSDDKLARHKSADLVKSKTPYKSFNQLQILLHRQTVKGFDKLNPTSNIFKYAKVFTFIEQFKY